MKKDLPLPERLESLSGRFVDVACGRNFAVLRNAAGQIWSFGDNRRGQLGRTNKCVPRQVKALSSAYVSWIACSDEDCFAIAADRSTMYVPAAGPNASSGSPSPGMKPRRRRAGSASPSPLLCAQLVLDCAPIEDPNNKLAHSHGLGLSNCRLRAWSERGWGSAWAENAVPVQQSSAFFEVHVLHCARLTHGRSNKDKGGIVRVGWRCATAHHDLGCCKRAVGFGGTGKKVFRGKYDKYGQAFGEGDVIGCLLSREGDSGSLVFTLNGRSCGVAFTLLDCGLQSQPLFPAVACLQAEVRPSL